MTEAAETDKQIDKAVRQLCQKVRKAVRLSNIDGKLDSLEKMVFCEEEEESARRQTDNLMTNWLKSLARPTIDKRDDRQII